MTNTVKNSVYSQLNGFDFTQKRLSNTLFFQDQAHILEYIICDIGIIGRRTQDISKKV